MTFSCCCLCFSPPAHLRLHPGAYGDHSSSVSDFMSLAWLQTTKQLERFKLVFLAVGSVIVYSATLASGIFNEFRLQFTRFSQVTIFSLSSSTTWWVVGHLHSLGGRSAPHPAHPCLVYQPESSRNSKWQISHWSYQVTGVNLDWIRFEEISKRLVNCGAQLDVLQSNPCDLVRVAAPAWTLQ